MQVTTETIATRIRQERQRLHLTQTDVAEALGVSTAYVCRIELGARVPSLQRLLDFAEVLQCSPAKFLRP